jgi:hypothetical protein
MRRVLTPLIVGLIVGGSAGWYLGYSAADKSWQNRSVIGVAVDCYDAQGRLVPDTWGKQFGGIQLSCAPGQTARVHQPDRKQ